MGVVIIIPKANQDEVLFKKIPWGRIAKAKEKNSHTRADHSCRLLLSTELTELPKRSEHCHLHFRGDELSQSRKSHLMDLDKP